MQNEPKPTFVLCVGAQKAGTSWLFKQMKKSPSVNLGFKKEYHVWDYVYLHTDEWRAHLDENDSSVRAAQLAKMRKTPGFYEEYFRGLISEKTRLTGDFTPAYCTLSSTQFDQIRRTLENAGFAVKVVFLMRDPAERSWSALKMLKRNKNIFPEISSTDDLLPKFENFFKRKQVENRNRYDLTVTALYQSFDPENLFFGCYEDMFNQCFITRLSKFLDIDLSNTDFGEHVNTHDTIQLPALYYDQCRTYYANVYAFCAQEFPKTTALWVAPQEADLA
ncbi:MAG: sulfotransferase [Paracoccaceae bacterium]|nr:sulfotransferase [Paracoccaceae bacterium]